MHSGQSGIRASSRHNNRRRLTPITTVNKNGTNAKINNIHEKEKYEDLYDELNLSSKER